MLKLTTKYKHLLTSKTNSALLIDYQRLQSTEEVCLGSRLQIKAWLGLVTKLETQPEVESRIVRNSRASLHLSLPSDIHFTNRKHLQHRTWVLNTHLQNSSGTSKATEGSFSCWDVHIVQTGCPWRTIWPAIPLFSSVITFIHGSLIWELLQITSVQLDRKWKSPEGLKLQNAISYW